MAEMMAAGNEVYTELKNLCVWSKTNAGMGSFYRSQHELISSGNPATVRTSTTWSSDSTVAAAATSGTTPGINTMRPGRLEELAMHPTVKPVALVADAIKDCSRRNGIILDPFWVRDQLDCR